MKKIYYTILLVIGFTGYVHAACPCSKHTAQHAPEVRAVNSITPIILKESKKTVINDNYSLKYNFAEKPKIGQSVLKIQIFGSDGKLNNNLEVSASYDMPSMRGHHATTVNSVKKNKKGVYLLPVNFVMPGDWEIVLTFKDAGQEVFVGVVNLEI
jgi:hypothetical protein